MFEYTPQEKAYLTATDKIAAASQSLRALQNHPIEKRKDDYWLKQAR